MLTGDVEDGDGRGAGKDCVKIRLNKYPEINPEYANFDSQY